MSEAEKLREWLGDELAVRLVTQLSEASQLADDIADYDVEINAHSVARLLHLCLVEIPSNPCYPHLWPLLSPMMSTAIQQWAASEEWRKHVDQDVRRWGWAMRDMLETIIPLLAAHLHGFERGLAVAVDAGIFFRTNADRESCETWELKP